MWKYNLLKTLFVLKLTEKPKTFRFLYTKCKRINRLFGILVISLKQVDSENWNSTLTNQPFEEIPHLQDVIARLTVEDPHSLLDNILIALKFFFIFSLQPQFLCRQQLFPELALDPDSAEEKQRSLYEHTEEILSQKIPVQAISDGLQS